MKAASVATWALAWAAAAGEALAGSPQHGLGLEGRATRSRRHERRGLNASELAPRHEQHTQQLSKRGYNGRATWYNVGLGACGYNSNSNEAVVALAEVIWNQRDTDGNPNHNGWCGQKITISYGGVQQQATIVDLCPVSGGCAASDGAALDLSQSLFQSFTGLGAGIFQMEWWPSGGSSSSTSDADDGASAAAAAAAQSSQDAANAAAAAASSSSSAAAAAYYQSTHAAAQAAASSSEAAVAAAAAASASSASYESWLAYNSAMSTSWDGVLAASRSSEAAEASIASVSSLSRASARAARVAAASSASVASQKSEYHASRVSAYSASAADASIAGPSSSAAQASKTTDAEAAANTHYKPETNSIPDSAIQAINDVSLRLANVVAQYNVERLD